MKLNIITRGMDLTPALEAHVERQITHTLSGLERHVAWVTVHLDQQDGADTPATCGLDLGIAPRGRLRFERVGDNLLHSLDELTLRAGLALGPLLENMQGAALRP